ncbi:ATP-binding protein [Sphingomonas sp. 22L2VL55-3]
MRDDAAGGCVRADRVQLENAVLNLAVNARDAMNGRGTLTVATGTITLAAEQVGRCAAGNYVTIMVGDDGCGMAPDVAERVFEPFFTTKEVGKGTGLGLSQIFALVQQLHGEVGIVSAPGEGTTVTLYLPRAAELVALPCRPSRSRWSSRSRRRSRRRCRSWWSRTIRACWPRRPARWRKSGITRSRAMIRWRRPRCWRRTRGSG